MLPEPDQTVPDDTDRDLDDGKGVPDVDDPDPGVPTDVTPLPADWEPDTSDGGQ